MQRAQDKLQYAHFKYSRVPAIKLDTLDADKQPMNTTTRTQFMKYINEKPLSDHMKNATVGNRKFVASVFLSHMSTYERIVATNYSHNDLDNVIMIFEDDVSACNTPPHTPGLTRVQTSPKSPCESTEVHN